MAYRIPILRNTLINTPLLAALAASLGAVMTLSAAPSIASSGVYNSASYALAGFPNSGVAQGSIFVVFGSGLGPSTIAYNNSLPYQTSLSGTSVTVTVGGTPVSCLMFYTSVGQVAAILPSTTPAGTGTITVTYNNATSPTAPITVVENALGLFTRSQQGSGPAVIQDANGNYNSYTNAFQPDETVTFWGTGLGPISGTDANTPPSGPLPGNPAVTANIGGQNAVVQYAGRSGYAGEDQINVTIPSGVTGCFVPVYFTVNGVPSNFVSMAISSSGSVCSDANLYTSTDLQNIANGQTLRAGDIILDQSALSVSIPGVPISIPPEESEGGTGNFLSYSANTFLSSLGGLDPTGAISAGCTVYQFGGGGFADPVLPTGVLDAGSVINVTGPNGTKQLTRDAAGQYSGTFVAPSLSLGAPAATPFLTPGTYTLDNGTGGKDVGAFKVNLTVPTPVTWSNKSSISTVSRSQDLQINWTGGAASGVVYVVGESLFGINTTSGDFQGGGQFACVAPASAGTLTVPAAVLSALPPSGTVTYAVPVLGTISLSAGVIIVSSSSTAPATVPGLDVFAAEASSGDGKFGVKFQ